MSETQSRPYNSRGRGSHRGGRGGHRGVRNGTRSHSRTDEQEAVAAPAVEEQGEVGELKRLFGNKVSSLREVFGDWSDEDLVYALKETDGDVDLAVDRISSGNIQQWGEVKKKQPKAKDVPPASETTSGARGGRSRGPPDGRGRGRGTERSRAGRGARGTIQTNGTKPADKTAKSTSEESAPAAEAGHTWDNTDSSNAEAGQPDGDVVGAGDWVKEPVKEAEAPVAASELKMQAPPASKVTGWAGLFAKPPPPPKKAPVPVPVAQPEKAPTTPAVTESLPSEEEHQVTQADSVINDPMEPPDTPKSDPPITLAPSKDELNETNLEKLPDVSHPPVSQTAASTVASTQEAQHASGTGTPALRPGMSGYAASALKATSGTGRVASFTRRLMDQQEAVVMPANHAVDRAAVQFGSMGLNGSTDEGDVDDDREEPETRPQMPEDSPAAPRTSLPPTFPESQPSVATTVSAPSTADSQPIQRAAPGLATTQAPQPPTLSPSAPSYVDQYRQKPYDPFGAQQAPQQPTQAPPPEPFTNQIPSQAPGMATSAPEYVHSAFYGSNARDVYQNYYGAYSQNQEAGQQRTGSAFGTSSQESASQHATGRPQQGYGQQEMQLSGQNTPNPSLQGHQTQQSQQMPQTQAGHGAYPYGYPGYNQQYAQYGGSFMNQMSHRYGANRPMFDDVRRQEDYYLQQGSQYGYGHNQQYGSSFGKSNMFGQPHHQYSYEQSSSPANAAGFGQSSFGGGRENTYGRSGSAQPSDTQQSMAGSTSFANIPDPFGRSHSGFGGQTQTLSQQQGGADDATKAYEGNRANGPSPSMAQSNRPASAISGLQAQQQPQGPSGAFPPPQSQHSGQQAFGGYPQYGGFGSATAHQQGQNAHQQTGGYAYGSNAAFGTTYGGYGSRGWNGSYGGGH